MKIQTLTKIARHQHGTLSLVQASHHGIGRPEWRALCRDGVIIEVFPDVGRLAGSPPTDLSTIKAATLAVGPDAIASHGSAALAWGAPSAGIDPVHVTLASRHRFTGIPGIALHRPLDLADLGPVLREHIPTTRPLRTLVDLGATDPREAMAAIFVTRQLPPFTFHAVIAGLEVDFLIDGTNIVLETDGWTTHGLDRDQFEFDREKDAVLREAGYVVQRFTWRQVRGRPAWVAQRILGTLRRWAPHVLAA